MILTPILYETYAPAREWGTRVIGVKRVSISKTAEHEPGQVYEIAFEYKFLPGIPPLTEWALLQGLKASKWPAEVEPTYMRVEATWLKAKALVQYRVLPSLSPVAASTVIIAVAVAVAVFGLAIIASYAYHIVQKIAPPPEVGKYVWYGIAAIGLAVPIFAVSYLLKPRRREGY